MHQLKHVLGHYLVTSKVEQPAVFETNRKIGVRRRTCMRPILTPS